MHLPIRPRRNRRTPAIRRLVRETALSSGDLIYPLFVHEDEENEPIESMPGCTRWSIPGLLQEATSAWALGIPAIILFPKIEDSLKTSGAEEAWNPDGLIPRAIAALKKALPDMAVITDIALDPYNSDGHDGLVSPDGRILNDETVDALCRQAICQARAGCDIVAPSDMMDGRVAALRDALDAEGFTEIGIMAYTAKYASAYYGPFRGALDSAPKAGDKKTYQMDPSNAREALREAELDEQEGADILLVKPAGPYLDVIARLRDHSDLPLAAYQVSGEYLMIKAASNSGWLNSHDVMMESLLGIKRAGADMILTYFAKEAAALLKQ